jgi:hypothetical protein
MLKYIDPTGHVKETPEQEAIEEGAVGGVSDIIAEKSETEKHTTIDKNMFLLHLGFVFTRDNGCATIGVVVFVTEGLGCVVQL